MPIKTLYLLNNVTTTLKSSRSRIGSHIVFMIFMYIFQLFFQKIFKFFMHIIKSQSTLRVTHVTPTAQRDAGIYIVHDFFLSNSFIRNSTGVFPILINFVYFVYFGGIYRSYKQQILWFCSKKWEKTSDFSADFSRKLSNLSTNQNSKFLIKKSY